MLFTHWFSINSWRLLVHFNVYFHMGFFVESFVMLTKNQIVLFGYTGGKKFNTTQFSKKAINLKKS